MKKISKVLMIGFLTGVVFFSYFSFSYSQQIQKVQPSLKPQPQQQPQASQQQKLNLPDLTIVGGLRLEREPSLVTVDGSGPHGGERWFAATFSFTVENIGTAYAPRFENWLVSEDTAGMMSGGMRTKNSLEPGRSKRYWIGFLLPKSYAGRTARIRAVTDYLGETVESNEGNNASAWFEVRLPLRIERPPVSIMPKPDLTVTIGTLTRNPSRDFHEPWGGFNYLSFNIPFTITNRGSANSSVMTPCWELSYYVPVDRSPAFTRGWQAAANGDCNQIEGGRAYPGFVIEDLQIPEFSTRIRVIVDPENQTIESNEVNNQATEALPIIMPIER